MEIYKLSPFVKQAIWGGKRLHAEYGKQGFEEIAETWELSGIEGKESRVIGGSSDGMNVCELISALGGKNALGEKAKKDEALPLLIKFIDSASPLSIQVHPDAKVACEIGGGAASKTEMWVICEAEPDAFLYFGMNRTLTKEEFEKVLMEGRLPEYLNRVPVKCGDVFFIPSGTIHAIGAGITICEIQETSDTTYRLYDYGRLDKDGNPRQLQIEESVRAADLTALNEFYQKPELLPDGGEKLLSCEFFTVYRRYGGNSFRVEADSFSAVTVTDGEGLLTCGDFSLSVRKGDTVFIPANSGCIRIEGAITLIDSRM